MRCQPAGRFAVVLGLLPVACTPITARTAAQREHPSRSSAPAPTISPAQLARDAQLLPDLQRRVVSGALDQLGAAGSRLDCSALVQRVYARAGLRAPRTVREQLRCGRSVGLGDLRPGDLVFFAFERRPADHVGIYAGRGCFVHASSGAGSVQLACLESAPFAAARVAARRLLGQTPPPSAAGLTRNSTAP